VPTTINGLPAHVLLVHVVVVMVPLASLLVVLAEVWPAFRRRAGIVVPLVALVALASVPVTKEAGEWLVRRVQPTALVFKHAQLADGLLPWVFGVFAVAAVGWGLRTWLTRTGRSEKAGTALRVVVPVVLAVAALVVATGAVVETYRIGDSGAQAAWHGKITQSSGGGAGDSD